MGKLADNEKKIALKQLQGWFRFLGINYPMSFRMTWYNITMNRAEKRSQKRKEVVEAVALRKEPVEVVARIHNIPLRNSI